MDNQLVYVITYCSPILSRNKYDFSELRHARIARHGATGLLLDKVESEKKREAELEKAYEKAAERAQVIKDSTPGMSSHLLKENEGFDRATEEEERKAHFRKITKKKKGFTIWDYSELEYDDLEKETAEKINQDHFYDEIPPIDIKSDISADEGFKKKLDPKLAGLIVLAVLSLTVSIMIIMSLF